jgi:hypothetical protein
MPHLYFKINKIKMYEMGRIYDRYEEMENLQNLAENC